MERGVAGGFAVAPSRAYSKYTFTETWPMRCFTGVTLATSMGISVSPDLYLSWMSPSSPALYAYPPGQGAPNFFRSASIFHESHSRRPDSN
jgi:hypothetical protein